MNRLFWMIQGATALICLTWLPSCGPKESICTSSFGNGQVKYEVPCIDGRFHGIYREYNKSGDLWMTKHYVNWVAEDTVRYFYSRTGELLKVVPVEKGEKEGEAIEYFKDGTIKRKQRFQQGKRVGEDISYHPGGKVIAEVKTYEANALNGPYHLHGTDGTPLVSGRYQAGGRTGEWEYFYPDGRPQAHISFEMGEKHGPFQILRRDGKLYLNGTFRRGLVNGEVTYFNRQGKASYTERWQQGKNLDYDPKGGMRQQYEGGQGGFSDLVQGFRIELQGDEIKIEG